MQDWSTGALYHKVSYFNVAWRVACLMLEGEQL